MSNTPHSVSPPAPAYRALVVAADADVTSLEGQLSDAGYETLRASPSTVPHALTEFAPDVTLVAVGDGDDARSEAINLVRRLRNDAATHALPIVILFREDARAMRGAALGMGADDYFTLAAPPAEMRARLEALFWRAEAGRRSAPAALDQHSEIDNFMLLLEAVRADVAGGAAGALALIGEGAGGEHCSAPLSEVYGFFKLNLRRADAIAFYGPTILLAYLPGRACAEARQTLAALAGDFSRTRRRAGPAVGLISFPEGGVEIEQLIERAENCLADAQTREGCPSVVAYGSGVGSEGSTTSPQTVSPAHAEAGARASSVAGYATGLEKSPARGVAGEGITSEAVVTAHDVGLLSVQSARAARLLDAINSANASLARAAESGAVRARRDIQGSKAGGPRRLLLVVSDAARMARLNLLIRSAHYEVRAAFDGQQALSLLRIERPDLVLVDQDLRDMEGVEMLRRLRRQQGGRFCAPALLLLEGRREESRREATEIGARAVVAMPYNPDEILDSIRSASGGDGDAM